MPGVFRLWHEGLVPRPPFDGAASGSAARDEQSREWQAGAEMGAQETGFDGTTRFSDYLPLADGTALVMT